MSQNNTKQWADSWSRLGEQLSSRDAQIVGCYIQCPYCLEPELLPYKHFFCGYFQHKCDERFVSEDMKRIFPILENGHSQFCAYCSRPAVDEFHYKNTLPQNTPQRLTNRTKRNVTTYKNKRPNNYLNRPDCGGRREMIARYLAVESCLSSQRAEGIDINTKEANNTRALFSQMHFPRFLDLADEFIRANPTVETLCGREGKCESKEDEAKRLQLQTEFMMKNVPAWMMGGRKKTLKNRRRNGKRKC